MSERGENAVHHEQEEAYRRPTPAVQAGARAADSVSQAPGDSGAQRPAGEPGDQARAGGARQGERAASGRGVEYREVPGFPGYHVGNVPTSTATFVVDLRARPLQRALAAVG